VTLVLPVAVAVAASIAMTIAVAAMAADATIIVVVLAMILMTGASTVADVIVTKAMDLETLIATQALVVMIATVVVVMTDEVAAAVAATMIAAMIVVDTKLLLAGTNLAILTVAAVEITVLVKIVMPDRFGTSTAEAKYGSLLSIFTFFLTILRRTVKLHTYFDSTRVFQRLVHDAWSEMSQEISASAMTK
jgi:hypothetical protein